MFTFQPSVSACNSLSLLSCDVENFFSKSPSSLQPRREFFIKEGAKVTADSLLGVEGCCRVVDGDMEAMGRG